MNIKSNDYFKDNADAWILDAYNQEGYNYPVGFHRLRILMDIVNELNIRSVLDLGCGGGQIAVALSKKGCLVHGIDQSEKMIANARSKLKQQSEEVRNRISYECQSIETVQTKEKHDAVVAMGLIGYLDNDDLLFKIASNVLECSGYFIVSFRNRLFNLFSISDRTILEIEKGNFVSLAEEASNLYHDIDVNCVRSFLAKIHEVSGFLLNNDSFTLEQSKESPSEKKGKVYNANYEARQTTPKEALDVAKRFGFRSLFLRGIHPHLLVPSINNNLPPKVYNMLSDSLIPLESNPISLLWSSVFIGVFQKEE